MVGRLLASLLATLLAKRSIPEHTAAGTLIGVPIAATDPEGKRVTYRLDPDGENAKGGSTGSSPGGSVPLGISSGGQIYVADPAALNFEASPVVKLDVIATDVAGLHTPAVIEVTVTNVAEPPRFDVRKVALVVSESAAGS